MQIFPVRTVPLASPSNQPLIQADSTINSTAHTSTQLATPGVASYTLPAELVGKREVATLRTATSATFDLGGNQYAVLQDNLPIHYQAADGSWQPIDPSFQRTAQGWLNNTNLLHTALSARSSIAQIGTASLGLEWRPAALALVTTDDEQQIVAQPLEGAAIGTQSNNGDSVRYPAHWNLAGLQDQWQSDRSTIEYTMRLPQLPTVQWWQATPEHLDLTCRITAAPGYAVACGRSTA